MKTAYCIDVSGSISKHQIRSSFIFIGRDVKPNDCIIVFDDKAKIVSLDWDCENWYGRGSDATDAIALAKEQGCDRLVLISDGYLMAEQLAQFDEFIDVKNW